MKMRLRLDIDPGYAIEMMVFDELPEEMKVWLRDARVPILATQALSSLRFWGSAKAAIADMERQIDEALAEEAEYYS
jgi:hypothetical protein